MRQFFRCLGRVELLFCASFCVSSFSFGHGDLHEQIAAVSAAIHSDPRNAVLYLKRAELHRLHQESLAAESDYAEAERLNPALAEVQLGRGKLLIASGEAEKAKRCLDRFLTVSPKHVDALATRARLEVKRNRPLAAAQDYARILALSPRAEPEYYLEYARALASIGAAEIPAALEVLDRGIVSIGPIPTLSLLAIELELTQKNVDGALIRLERLSAISKRKESYMERRGDILQQAGRFEEAQAAYHEALRELGTLPRQVRSRKATSELEKRLRGKTGPLAAPKETVR